MASPGTINFAEASRAFRLSNGTIVIVDRSEPALRFFDARGRTLRTVGRSGSGPGEFRSLVWAGQCAADSVFAWDVANQRMSVFSAAGMYVRQFAFPVGVARAELGQVSCAPTGTTAVVATTGVVRGVVTGAVAVASSPGGAMRAHGTIIAGELVRLGTLGMEPRPLAAFAMIAVTDDGAYSGTGADPRVMLTRANGSQRDIPLNLTAAPTTRAAWVAALEAHALKFGKASREAALRAMLALPMPATLPHYFDLAADASGAVWITTSAPGARTTTLLVVASDGAVLGTVDVRAGFSLHDVGADYLLGVREDEDGVQHVVMYRLHRQ